MGNSWSKHEEKQHDFQPYAVFSYMIKRNTVDSLSIPAINGSYVTVIPEDRNDLLNLLPSFQAAVQKEGIQTQPGNLPELKRQSL